MQHYFFDVVGRGRSELDYAGRILPTPEAAYDTAELMALDLAVKRADDVMGWAVSVSSIDGRKLFSIPVQASYLARYLFCGTSQIDPDVARVTQRTLFALLVINGKADKLKLRHHDFRPAVHDFGPAVKGTLL